jgi:hypothetical protein
MLFETDLGKDRGKKVLCCDLIFVSQTSCNGHYTINKKAFHSFKKFFGVGCYLDIFENFLLLNFFRFFG